MSTNPAEVGNEITQEITVNTTIDIAVFCELCGNAVNIADIDETENQTTGNDGIEIHVTPCDCLKGNRTK